MDLLYSAQHHTEQPRDSIHVLMETQPDTYSQDADMLTLLYSAYLYQNQTFRTLMHIVQASYVHLKLLLKSTMTCSDLDGNYRIMSDWCYFQWL